MRQSITLNATVGEDRTLTVVLPDIIKPGAVAVTVKEITAASDDEKGECLLAALKEFRSKYGMKQSEINEILAECKKDRR